MIAQRKGYAVTLIDRLNAAKTLDELDTIAVEHRGYWTNEERAAYERRVRFFREWEGDSGGE